MEFKKQSILYTSSSFASAGIKYYIFDTDKWIQQYKLLPENSNKYENIIQHIVGEGEEVQFSAEAIRKTISHLVD